MTVRPAKTQVSLGICPVWSESSLWVEWVAKDPSFLHADSKDSDQTGRMPRLIWIFAGRTLTLLVLSWGGSFIHLKVGIIVNIFCRFLLQLLKLSVVSDPDKCCENYQIFFYYLYMVICLIEWSSYGKNVMLIAFPVFEMWQKVYRWRYKCR